LFANAREELLPADKAFAFKAKVVNDKILLNWDTTLSVADLVIGG
jgi:hypothetical protein